MKSAFSLVIVSYYNHQNSRIMDYAGINFSRSPLKRYVIALSWDDSISHLKFKMQIKGADA